MRLYPSTAIIGLILLSSILWTNPSQAEDLAFHNILTVSRSIIAPSQYYQVQKGLLIEAGASTTDGSFDLRTNTYAVERDLKGKSLSGGAFLAINPTLVLALTSGQTNLHVTATGKVEQRWINPSLTYSPLSTFTLAAQTNLLRGENKPQTTPTLHRKTNNFTFAMTAHEESWEATAVLNTKKKDPDNTFDSIPQSVGLHTRIHVSDPITLGLNYERADYTAIAPPNVDFQDQSRLGLHLEAAMSENFSLELDYTGSHNDSGIKDRKGTESVILWQILISPDWEGGAKLTYETFRVPNVEVRKVSPGLFFAAHF